MIEKAIRNEIIEKKKKSKQYWYIILTGTIQNCNRKHDFIYLFSEKIRLPCVSKSNRSDFY